MQTSDMAEQDLFAPLFRGVERFCHMVRTLSWSGVPTSEPEETAHAGRVSPIRVLVTGMVAGIRRGSLHVYLLFIVLTLLVVFFYEAFNQSSPMPPSPSTAPAIGMANGVQP